MNSTRDKLDTYFQQVSAIILSRQNPVTGLIPASVAVNSHGDYRDAWVRDNVYSILAVWALSLAYKRIDDNEGRGYELEHATVKCMRGLLFSMMRQARKVEVFKNSQAPQHSLHAKYNTATGDTVVGDYDWGHLQLDATSIYLLMLGQMTASGLQIVYTLDEVNFIQNLTFYIERAYRTPDYGIWERGNKVNHGTPELNSSSIGMCVAALQAINGVNLFGAKGGPNSVIHVLPDEMTRNTTTLYSALPRESYSKEVDAALLSVISYPAFSVADKEIVERTRSEIVKKLEGKYGCKRFLRDGHQTVLEDTTRLHYDPSELKIFENVECEWPLFFTYMILDGLFRDDLKQAEEYQKKLAPLLVSGNHLDDSTGKKDTFKLVPELYIVPKDKIDAEKKNPGSQERVANENIPLVWAQSLYTLGKLVTDGLLSVAELDPLERRLNSLKVAQKSDPVVQIVLLAENAELQGKLAMYGIETQTIDSCAPVTISPPSALKEAFSYLGHNSKLGLSGRPKRPIGTLSTCKLYRCQGKLYGFLPHFMDKEEFYLVNDNDYLIATFEQELKFVKNHWNSSGRPTMIIVLTSETIGHSTLRANTAHNFKESRRRSLLNFVISVKSGVFGGVRVRLGRLSEMINTACIESLDFLVSSIDSPTNFAWTKLLRGTETLNENMKRLTLNETATLSSVSSAQNDVDFKERRTPASRKTRRMSSIDVSSKVPAKSPLTSPLYSEEPLEYGLESLPSPVETPAGLFPVQTGRSPSPLRGAPSNRSVMGTSLVSDGDFPQARRQSYQFDIQTNSGKQSQASSNESLNKLNPLDLNGNPQIPIEDVVETLTFTLGDSSRFNQAINLLRVSANLYDQIDLLHYLHSCKGIDYYIENLGTIGELLQEVYVKANWMKQWSIVRQAAGILRKVVNSLTINVTDLLIRQKPLTIGFAADEYFISSPMSPAILAEIIFKHCASDVREAPLVMEILTYLGSYSRSNPRLFDGIMRLRINFFIIAMREEISRMRGCNEEEAVEYLMQLSPFEVKTLLGQVLAAHDETNETDSGLRSTLFSSNPRSRPINLTRDNSQIATTTLEQPISSHAADFPQLVDKNFIVSVQSAGFTDGNFCKFEVRKGGIIQDIPVSIGRGLNVAVFDISIGALIEFASFDTHISKEESEEFAHLLEWLEPGSLIVVASKDDCSENLTEAAKEALENMGSKKIRNVNYRDSWCIIATKGLPTALEYHNCAGSGPTGKLSKTCTIAETRKRAVSISSTEDVQSHGILSHLHLPSDGVWLRRRKNDGALNRVPKDFYPKVWHVLTKVQEIVIGKNSLPRDPTVSEKTPEEFNFALQVEGLLDIVGDPAERQSVVECLEVITLLLQRNPEFHINTGKLDLLKVVRDAISRSWVHCISCLKAEIGDVKINSHDCSFEKNERIARRIFFDLPQEGDNGTMTWLAQSCSRLVFDVKWSGISGRH